MRKYILPLLLMAFSLGAQAQIGFVGYGFRAGMSFAKIDGPSEIGPNGEELEKNKMASGFHIGMSLSLKFTDIMGVRTELLYSQRGTDYSYVGPTEYIVGKNTVQNVIIRNGTRNQTLNVSNSYVDVPVTAYYRIGYFEISGGLNTGLLVGSAAGGSIAYGGTSPNGNAITPFEVNLNYNYKSDEAGFASEASQNVLIDGKSYVVPEFVGAYYEFPTKDKSLYKTLDFGVIGGLAYFLNDGLYLSAKYIHGLGDADRNDYDISLQKLNLDGTSIPRADKNTSQSWQFSVGFTF